MIERLFELFGVTPDCRTFVFIVTYGRSGSTLLQRMLSTIPKSYILGENVDALAGLFQSYRSAAIAKRKHGNRRRSSVADPWRGVHLINPERYNRKLAATFIEEILHPPPNATLVGFKEIRYLEHDDLEEYLDYLRRTFRPCVLVFNRRNADAVAASARRKDHGYPNDSAKAVCQFDQRVDAYVSLHRDDCEVVIYDDYIRNPQVLLPLFGRLGACIDEAKLRKVLLVDLKH